MCQQTQVGTVIPYYLRWMTRFPTVESLAEADDQEVLTLWQGLGYYRRCRLLLAGARHIVREGLPNSALEWGRISGVGRYTAGAIASISLQEPTPVVDGNVERVFARVSTCELSGEPLHQAAWRWAAEQVHPTRPGDWNQALMELGATVCKPRESLCSQCPLSSSCVAFQLGRQLHFPVVKPKENPIAVRRQAVVHLCDGSVGLEQIPAGEWWESMWRHPRVALGEAVSVGTIRHTVTNHRITMAVSVTSCVSEKSESLRWVRLDEIEFVPIPTPHRRALNLALAAQRVE